MTTADLSNGTSNGSVTPPPPSSFRRIWIGGTSGLARTYFNAFQNSNDGRHTQQLDDSDEPWLVTGHQPQPPAWMAHFPGLHYYPLDFVRPSCDNNNNDKAASFQRQALLRQCNHVQQVVISIRPPLVDRQTFAQAATLHNQMITGLSDFLQQLIEVTTRASFNLHILHVSSIAAIDHVQLQYLRSEASVKDPSSDSLYHPYDRFKRRCEEVLQDMVEAHSALRLTNVRLGAIFSDDPRCIQCHALALQARVGCYLRTRIDCNSARNVAVLLHCMLMSTHVPAQRLRTFYYTRPLSWPGPVPYGLYLQAYRRAHDIWVYVWIPVLLVQWVVAWVHYVAQRYPHWPFVQSVDYLLQVTRRGECRHSYICSYIIREMFVVSLT